MMSIRRQHEPPSAHPTSPDLIKRVEKEILNEAKHEEQSLKDTIKDLSKTEKTERKAQKAAVGGEHALEKAEKHEHKTLKNLHKTEHNHDIAVTNVHKAQHDLEVSTKNYGKIQQGLAAKKAKVEAAIKTHDDNTRERNAKLIALRGPGATNESGRVITEVEGTAPTLRN